MTDTSQQTMSDTNDTDHHTTAYDVLIAGGGLAGLSLALQLCKARPQTRIAIIEAGSFPRPKAITKIGESTVEIFSHYLRDRLGLKQFLQNKQLKKFGIRMFFGKAERIDQLDELGASKAFGLPTYQIDRGDLENELYQQLSPYQVSIYTECTITALDANADKKRIAFTNSCDVQEVLGSWLVDCSGRAGLLKKELKLTTDTAHIQHALWFRINKTIKIDSWSENASWHKQCQPDRERWLSTNHFAGAGYWLWIIPLSSGATSIGIVFDDQAFQAAKIHDYSSCLAWIQREQPLCRAAIADEKALDFVIANNYSYSAKQLFSPKRWALVGEAGVFADPFYSPGGDFIAFGNDFVASFIEKDLNGEDASFDIVIANKVMLAIFDNTLRLYQNIYGGFGDRKLMSVKLLWDYSYYWGVLAYVFWTGSLKSVERLREVAPLLSQSQKLNASVQDALSARAEKRETAKTEGLFFDQYKADCLRTFHQVLEQASERDDPIPVLTKHIEMLEKIKGYCLAMLQDGDTAQSGEVEVSSELQSYLGEYHNLLARA